MFVIVIEQLHRERSPAAFSSRIKSTLPVVTSVHVPSQFDTGATVHHLSRNSSFDRDTLGKIVSNRHRVRCSRARIERFFIGLLNDCADL